jgi:F-type H+-transporting ATPase subunit delta
MMAGRYARALAEIAGENDAAALGPVGAQLDLVARMVTGEPALAKFFDSPTARPADKETALATLVTRAQLSDLMRRFLAVVIDKRRMSSLPAIAAAFTALHDRAAGIVPVEATVAVGMDEAEAARFRAALETMTGRQVRLSVTIDPEIVGGVQTRIGSRVYDGTLKSHLRALHRRLAEAH